MISEDGVWLLCEEKDCHSKVKNDRWSQIHADDWFFQKNGTVYCPAHLPKWVGKWRAKAQEKKERDAGGN